MEVIGGISGVVSLIGIVGKLAKRINEYRDKYQNVSLYTTLAVTQLSTIRAALEAIAEWRLTSNEDTPATRKLDDVFAESLRGCAVLITVIDAKLGEANSDPGVKDKLKHLWIEDVLKEYMSNLEGQVQGLQLLLSIHHCTTVTEQIKQLEKGQTRSVFDRIRADTASLTVGNKDIPDTASVLSLNPSVNLEQRHRLPKPISEPSSPIFPSSETFKPTIQGLAGAHIPEEFEQEERTNHPEEVSPLLNGIDSKGKAKESAKELSHTSEWNIATSPSSSNTHYLGISNEPPLESAVEAFKGQLNLAFEENSPTRLQPTFAISRHESDVDESDNDEMITGLPLASHFDISRKPGNRSSFQHSRGSSSSMPQDKGRVIPLQDPSSASISGRVSPGPLSASSKNRLSSPHSNQAIDRSSLHPGSGRSIHSVETTNTKPESTDSDLYESSIVAQEKKEDADAKEDNSADTNVESAKAESSMEQLSDTRQVADATLPSLVVEENTLYIPAQISTESDVKERDEFDLKSSENQPTEMQVLTSASSEESPEPAPPTRIPPVVPAQPQRNVSPFKNPGSANSLLIKDLMNPNFVRYSNNEKHDLTIILTEEKNDSNNRTSDSNEKITRPTRKPPPVPPVPPISSLPSSNPSNDDHSKSGDTNPLKYMMSGALNTPSPERDGSMAETLSTLSSSDRSDGQIVGSPRTSASNTIATSISANQQDTLRTQAQIELQKLQQEHAAAKSRGDLSAAKASLQKSKEIIQKTYLSDPTTKATESEEAPARSKSNRKSLMPMKSISRLSAFGKRSKVVELHEAARTGNLDLLQRLLEENISPNTRGENYKTPLMEAALSSHLNCLSALKYHGADEFAIDQLGRTVLHVAVMANQHKAVAWLLQSYPPPPAQVPKRKSSRISRATEVMIRLQSHKILREVSDGEGSKPLHVASKLSLPGIAKLLLDDGAVVDSRDNWGRTPLMDAIIFNHQSVMLVLLGNGADIAAVDFHSMTSLHWAAKYNRNDLLKILLERGADRAVYDNNGYLPIHQAAREGHIEAIECLLNEKLQLDVQTKFGETLLHLAVLSNHQKLAEYLLKHNVNVNAWAPPHSYQNPKLLPPSTPIIPLHYSCTKGYFEMTMTLLDQGAWVNAAPDNGMSPLMMAVETGNTNLVCLLLARGAKVNAAVPGSCMTAIHISCRRGDLETTQVLVQHGAKRNVRTSDQHTPAELVSKVKDAKKRKALENYLEEMTRQDYERTKHKLAKQQAEREANPSYSGPGLTPTPSPVIIQQTVQQQQQQLVYDTGGPSLTPRSLPQQYLLQAIPGQTMYNTTTPAVQQQPQHTIDPEYDSFPEAPPAYYPGPNAPQRLVNRPGVNRPN
ncbi:MAG: hypothetical protein Q9167_007251 [Letrouitia subvulpina]